MKEMEKIQRISVVSVLFVLLVIIGLLTYKRPKNTFAINTKPTLEKLTTDNFFVSLENSNKSNFQLIDIRSSFEFEKGHLENAINMATSDILDDENIAIFKELKNKKKTALLYGKNPEDVNPAFLILYQLGYDDIKILTIETYYFQTKLIAKNCEVEKSENDIQAFITESAKNSDATSEIKTVQPIKKVIMLQQKKKKKAEGGC